MTTHDEDLTATGFVSEHAAEPEVLVSSTPGFAGGGDRRASELRAELLADFGGSLFTPAVCDELLDKLGEDGWLGGGRARVSAGDPRWHDLLVKMLNTIRWLKKHEGPVAFYAAWHAWDVPEFDDINGNLSQKEFAQTQIVGHELVPMAGTGECWRDPLTKEMTEKPGTQKTVRRPVFMTKAAVNNAVKDFQSAHGLPPRQDQRDDEACDAMTASRFKSIAKGKTVLATDGHR